MENFEEWFECNKDGDILAEAYQNYFLDSAGIPDDEVLNFRDWAEEYFYTLY